MEKLIDPGEPKMYPVKDLPAHVMAGVLTLWKRELGKLPEDTDRVVFTYFDGIYTNHPISEDLYIHEMVHFVRQGNGKDKNLADVWWLSYLDDKEFRYQEELMAYKEQYKFAVNRMKLNRQQKFELGRYLAKELASEKYGRICTADQAFHDIFMVQ